MRKLHDWSEIQRYYDNGHSGAECRARFDISYGAWAVSVQRGKMRLAPARADDRRRYDWLAVQAYYNEGYSFRQCEAKFGFSHGAWHKAVKRGEIKPRPLGRPLQDIVRNGKARTNIKRRLIKAGLLKNRCQICGIEEWLGERLTIQIDHVNGIRDDYGLENLRMLCPNCHSQTENYGRRNCRRRRLHESGDPV